MVGADGSVYPCDFYVLDAFRLGNLRQDSLETVNRCRKARVFYPAVQAPAGGVSGLPPIFPCAEEAAAAIAFSWLTAR